jgi:hypothetical protein
MFSPLLLPLIALKLCIPALDHVLRQQLHQLLVPVDHVANVHAAVGTLVHLLWWDLFPFLLVELAIGPCAIPISPARVPLVELLEQMELHASVPALLPLQLVLLFGVVHIKQPACTSQCCCASGTVTLVQSGVTVTGTMGLSGQCGGSTVFPFTFTLASPTFTTAQTQWITGIYSFCFKNTGQLIMVYNFVNMKRVMF